MSAYKQQLIAVSVVVIVLGSMVSPAASGLAAPVNPASASASIQGATDVNVTGNFMLHPSGPAKNNTVHAVNEVGYRIAETTTNATGAFEFNGLAAGTNYSLVFQQANLTAPSSTDFPRDGSPDVFVVNVHSPTTDQDLGSIQLPEANQVTVTVENESGVGVANAPVFVAHRPDAGGFGSIQSSTNATGDLVLGADPPSGVELTGNVTFTVFPPGRYGPTIEDGTTYYEDGPYYRNVTVDGPTDVVITLNETEPPSANLTLDPPDPTVGEAVNISLTNRTGPTPNAYSWQITGPATEYDYTQPPNSSIEHTFPQPGEYTITVYAYGDGETTLFTTSQTVAVGMSGTGDLVATPASATANVTNVSFALQNVSGVEDGYLYNWQFGDGAGDSTTHPNTTTTHIYSSPGTYQATVTVRNKSTEALVVQDSTTVEVTRAGSTDLKVDPTPARSGNAVNFTLENVTGTTPAEYVWDFGDGSNMTTGPSDRDVEYTYVNAGSYGVVVRALDAQGRELYRATESIQVLSGSNFVGVGDWPQFHFGEANSGYNPTGIGPTGPVTERWSVSFHNAQTNPVTVAGGKLFVVEGDSVQARDAADGTHLWSTSIAPAGNERFDVTTAPIVADGQVYVGAYHNNSIGQSHEEVYALDAASGVRLWNYSVHVPGWTEGDDFFSDGHETLTPKVADGRLFYVGEPGDRLHAVDATAGSGHGEVWRTEVLGQVRGAPALADGTVYVQTESTLYAFDADAPTPTELWNTSISGLSVGGAAPSVGNDLVVVAGDDGTAIAFNASTGSEEWTGSGSHAGSWGSATIAGDLVLVPRVEPNSFDTHTAGVAALNATDGSEVWTFTSNGSVYGAPAVVGVEGVGVGRIAYVGTINGTLHGIDVSTGEELWNHTLPMGEQIDYGTSPLQTESTPFSIFTAPAVANSTVYVRAGSNGLLTRGVYAIGDSTPRPSASGDLNATPTSARVNHDTVTLAVEDQTGATPAEYRFDFGDGTAMTVAHPDVDVTHVYSSVGTYIASVTALDGQGRALYSSSATVTVVPAGSATLVATPNPAKQVVETVNFSLGNRQGTTPDHYVWSFGDGHSASTSHPDADHAYETAGNWTATVTAYGASGGKLWDNSTVVNVTQSGSATLVIEPTTVDVNHTTANLTLQNMTLPDATSVLAYDWTFGDRDTDFTYTNNTTHVYSQLGTLDSQVAVLGQNEQALFTVNTTVNVVDRVPPNVLAFAPTRVYTGERFLVGATDSTDNHHIKNFTFTTDEAAGPTNDTTEDTATLWFETPGVHNVSVTARDPAGNENTTNVSVNVLPIADLAVRVNDDPPQTLTDGSGAVNLTVYNNGTADVSNATVRLNTSLSYWSPYRGATFMVDAGNIPAGEQKTVNVDLSNWVAGNITAGRSTAYIDATIDPADDVLESDETNNEDAGSRKFLFTDLGVSWVNVPSTTISGENATVTVVLKNYGSGQTGTHDATVEFGDGTTQTVSVPPLDRFETHRVTLKHSFPLGDHQVNATIAGDPEFPANNRSHDDTTTENYSMYISHVRSPRTVERGETFRVRATVRQNYAADVNTSIELPDGLDLVEGDSKNKTMSPHWGSTVYPRWTVKAVNTSDEPYRLNVTASAHGQTDADYTTTSVVFPKIRLTNETATSVQDDGVKQLTLEVRNESTFEHTLSMTAQQGAQGRTLAGLEYLFAYPHGCIEQTTSPLLGALNVDSYYRDNPSSSYSDDDRNRVQGQVQAGVTRLAPGGGAGQHANGAWSMWGNDDEGDVFYTAYALYGTGSVTNDAVLGSQPELSTVDYDAAVLWLADHQAADGRIPNDKAYFRDDYAMTGFTLLAIEKGGPYNATATAAATELRANATRYLLENQHADGYWETDGDSNSLSTSVAIWGLQSAVDGGLGNSTLESQAEAAIEDGSAWLISEQDADGAWRGYQTSFSWSGEGQTSHNTAYATLALNATGVPADNETIESGLTYLVGVFDEGGSWGYTRASAISIEALQTLGTDGTAQQTVDVTFSNETRDVLTVSSTVDSGNTPRAVLSLNQTQREMLRAASDGTLNVTVDASGTGLMVVALENEQVVNRDEYEANGGGS